MSHWSVTTWAVVLIAGTAALYGLHRMALHLEDAGRIYYLRKRPSGGGGSNPFVALQQIIEPKSQQVLVVRDLASQHEQDREVGRGPASAGDAPPDAADAEPERG